MAMSPTILPGLWLRYYRALQDLERARRVAMEPVKEIKERMARVRRAAQREGADLFALKLLDSFSRLSEADAQKSWGNFVHYVDWASYPIGYQGKLFAKPNTDEISTHNEWVVETDGREAAFSGDPRESNPHEDVALRAVWDRGWESGEALRVQPVRMPDIDLPVPMAPKRARGRPKGVKNKPKAKKVVARLRRADREPSIAAGF